MSYRHETFRVPMEHPPSAMNMYFGHPAPFPAYMHQSGAEMMVPPFAFAEYGGYMHPSMLADEFDDAAEISTRPRLTKEQVDILESQFQAHPKPNSMVKKQLAMQTKLTLPRVANWFQNRRAKAKQLKKQEEYETQQHLDATSGAPSDGGDHLISDASENDSAPTPASPDHPQPASASQSPSRTDTVKETWLSLQRALGANKAMSKPRGPDHDQIAMPPPDLPRPIPISHAPSASQTSAFAASTDWTASEPAVPDHLNFDFGFDQEPLHVFAEQATPVKEHFVHPPAAYSTLVSPPLAPVPYPQSARRGSASDELAANFGTFALAGTPPVRLSETAMPVSGGLDIASRRKRPRPAALTSASLRSRSYGAMSSTSPSFRTGPPSGGQLRQVKSTGFGLNAHYAGIRKAGMAQKSPLNISSFAEAEALSNLMAHPVAGPPDSTTPTPATQGALDTRHDMTSAGYAELAQLHGTPSDLVAQYTQLSSPPTTPFQSDFLPQHAMGGPASVTSAQYASFADCTPPYSAGPLTNSTCSWSDAPLQSPELPNFLASTYMPSMGFNQPDAGLPPWVLPSDHLSDMTAPRKTEFYITEFPGQREEHASVAQQVVPQRPKNYVFANTAPCDYDL